MPMMEVESVLLHIPHSSTKIPDDVRAGLLIDAEELERELSSITDRHTDELFSAEGADRLVFGFSRLVVDPERFEDDAKEPMAARGMGAVYTRTSTGKPLRSGADRAELMARYYEPHHRRLNEWAEAALARHGCCLVIDCHSFPSLPLACDLDPLVERPMFCVGTDPFHTPPALRDAVVVGLRQIANEMLDIRDARNGRKPRFANRMRRVEQAVLVDRPYAGTMVPSKFYGTDARVASVMIEVNRGLYMEEATGQRNETHALVRERLGETLEDLSEAWREQVVSRAMSHTPQQVPQPRKNESSPASGNTFWDSEETFTGLSEYGQLLVMEQLEHRGLEDTPSNREKLAKELMYLW